MHKVITLAPTIMLLASTLTGCGYTALQSAAERVDEAAVAMLDEYQRRTNLVPKLLDRARRLAPDEAGMFAAVTHAQARAHDVQSTPVLLTRPAEIVRFEAAQREFERALSRLQVVTEDDARLNSDADLRHLQAQLARIDNRIAFARERYMRAVHAYNTAVNAFPSNLMMIADRTMPNLTARTDHENGAATQPGFDRASVKHPKDARQP